MCACGVQYGQLEYIWSSHFMDNVRDMSHDATINDGSSIALGVYERDEIVLRGHLIHSRNTEFIW